MHRRSRVLPLLALGLASTLVLAACGDTESPTAEAASAADAHTSQALDRADLPTTTTTVAPTTTVPPTTTTVAPPTTTAPKTTSSGATTKTSTKRKTTVVATPAPAPKPAATSACTDSGMLSSINRERAKKGLGALTLRGGATSVACTWSKHMTASGLGHNGHLSGDLAAHGVTGWKSLGENVGYGSSASQVFSMFMGSSGHRANILKASYTQVGIGVVKSGSRIWVTLDFVGY